MIRISPWGKIFRIDLSPDILLRHRVYISALRLVNRLLCNVVFFELKRQLLLNEE
jgi:hypothetical protein